MPGIGESPKSLFVAMIMMIAATEVMVMRLIHSMFPRIDRLAEDLLDGFLLVVFLSLPLYLLIIRPLLRQLNERRQAEQAVRESEELFHEMFTQNDDPLVLFRLDSFAIIDANHAMIDLFALHRPHLARLDIRYLIDRQALRRILRNLRRKRAGVFQVPQGECIRPDGNRFPVSIRGKVLTLKNEYAVLCSIRDLTAKLRLEEEIRTTQAKLIQANKMTSLGMLVSTMAHEINNPNNYLSMNARMLADMWHDALPVLKKHHRHEGEFYLRNLPFSKVEELAPRLFTGIIDGSQRISSIVNDMKDFAREDRTVLPAEIDINKAVEHAAAILYHQIQRHTRDFRTDLHRQLPAAHGKPQQLEQVFVNLITNALQSLPDPTRGVLIATSVDTDTNQILVTVQDWGMGMDRRTLQRLTEPFFTTRGNSGGTGLGLYISAAIIKDHHGTLTFESTPGSGTVATVRLPAAR